MIVLQVRAIVRNRTGIEDWIVEKAEHRRKSTKEVFVYPYNLGFWTNVKQVINLNCTPVGDGINWPVLKGCDQYTLTVSLIYNKITHYF